MLERNGSTYTAKTAPDFLQANDAWFMPVAQKTGPDGCLYILDWYDRYHCYQDANRDPAGIDRLKGRLYRVRYKETPRRVGFDLARSSDDELIKLLGSPNVYDRDIAQRLLTERGSPAIRGKLEALVLDEKAPRTARMHGLWALIGSGPLEPGFHARLLAHDDPTFRAWGVRAAGNMGKVDADDPRRGRSSSADDPSPDVRLQVAIAARKIEGVDPLPLLLDVQQLSYRRSADSADRLAEPASACSKTARSSSPAGSSEPRARDPGFSPLVPRAIERLLASPKADAKVDRDAARCMLVGRRLPRSASTCWPSGSATGACRRRSRKRLRRELIKVVNELIRCSDCPQCRRLLGARWPTAAIKRA